LGRPRKGQARDKAQDLLDECERVEVERRFSLEKRKCGMGLITAKLQETAAHVIAMSVLVLNLRKIQYALLHVLVAFLGAGMPHSKMAFVQYTLVKSKDFAQNSAESLHLLLARCAASIEIHIATINGLKNCFYGIARHTPCE